MESLVSNKLLEARFESSLSALLIVDHNGIILMVNASCAKMFGYSENELFGQKLEMLLDQKIIKHFTQFLSSVFDLPHSIADMAGYKWLGLSKTGDLFPFEMSCNVMEVDNTRYANLSLNYISKQRQAAVENSLISKIFHESLNDIYIIDARDFRFINANAGALHKIGYSLEELKQLKPWDIKPDYDQAVFLQHVAPLFSGEEKKIIFESIFVRKDQSTFPVEIHLQLFEHENQHIFMETVFDITEKRKEEKDIINALIQGQELERARIAKELHDELGQALTAMQLNLHTLEYHYDKLNKKPIEIFNKLKLILFNTIQELKSISRDLMPSVLKDYGLVRALEYLCENFNDTLHLQVSLEVYNMEKKLDTLRRIALYRIAQELINNACKHGIAKKINVQLIRNTRTIVLRVEDDGIGFDPSAINVKSGIGLKNIESRIIALDGTFTLDSHPGNGTSVTVEIPLKNMHEHY